MIYPIVKYGQPVLETKALAITEFDTRTCTSWWRTCSNDVRRKGVGLAAPQIGVGKRIAVIDTTVGEDPGQKLVLINPEIIGKEGSQSGEEGCLSLPTFRETVTRAKKVTVRAFDAKGKPFEMTGKIFSPGPSCIETDHLNGMLYISHISPLKRDLIRRKVRKLQKANEWG